MSLYEKLKGKKVDVNYETGYHFVIEYLSDNELEWEALADAAEGAPREHAGGKNRTSDDADCQTNCNFLRCLMDALPSRQRYDMRS